MTHPSFDIINKVGRAAFCKPDRKELNLFRDKVWDMRVYFPGERFDLPNEHSATHFSLNRGVGKGFPSLPLYLRESDAVKARGPESYFAAGFHLAILFSESFRADVHLFDGAESIIIPHEHLLNLRDMAALVVPSVLAGDDEAGAQKAAMLAFAVRAKAYCARHADVNSLHLASLATSRPMLVGTLSANDYARHVNALRDISMDLLRPGWRFVLLEEAQGHAALIKTLRKTPPCYVKVPGQGWWDKLKSQFEPALPLVGLKPI